MTVMKERKNVEHLFYCITLKYHQRVRTQGNLSSSNKEKTINVLLHVNCPYVPLFASDSARNSINYKVYFLFNVAYY